MVHAYKLQKKWKLTYKTQQHFLEHRKGSVGKEWSQARMRSLLIPVSIRYFVMMASEMMYVRIFQTMCFEYNFIVSYISVKLAWLRLLEESLCYFQWIHTS